MSEYSIKVLNERAERVKEDLARYVADEDQLAEREARCREELQQLSSDRLKMTDAVRAAKAELVGLQDDVARLQETKPNAAPDPGPVPERKDARTRTPLPDLDRGIQERHEAEERERGRKFSKDPLHVHEKESPSRSPKGAHQRVPAYEGGVDLEDLSPTERIRAQLAFEILATEPTGKLAQWRWAMHMTAELGCKPQTGASILSKAIKVLVTERRVLWTGEKVAASDGGRRGSAVWITYEAATPDQRAAAGLGTGEENFAGRTSRWPTPSTSPPKGSRITQESSGYETSR